MIEFVKKYIAVGLLLSLLGLIACETKQQGGSLLGGTAGALIGSRFGTGTGRIAATALGAVGGTLIGSNLGRFMDQQDKIKMHKTSQGALESSKSGHTASWKNPDSGHKGSVTPYQAYKNDNGQYCREYMQTITVARKTHQGYGTACRQTDGSWKIVK